MRSLKFDTFEQAKSVCERLKADALQTGLISKESIDYVIPIKTEFWTVPILEGFERFLAPEELKEIEKTSQGEVGLKIIDEIIEYLDSELDIEDSSIFLNRIISVLVMLQIGNLPAARTRAETITTTQVYSAERKAWLISRISQEI
jgi:hypothetical protein